MQLPSPLPEHPRLLLREGDWARLRLKIETDGPSAALYRTLQHRAEVILTEPPVAREMTGRMLLMISRQALERICVLSMVAGVSEDARYAARAIDELIAVCRFAEEMGCRYALLNATGMGEPVYRRIGFRGLAVQPLGLFELADRQGSLGLQDELDHGALTPRPRYEIVRAAAASPGR